jgi:ribosomal-protein-serine acetyltransferase
MEHMRVSPVIRLEKINVSMAQVIFDTIKRDQDYLKTWLPFVEFTQKVEDTVLFIQSVSDDEPVLQKAIYSIWVKEEFAGLIGFNEIDWTNKKTELGYWLAEKMQGKGIITLCAQKLINYAFLKLKLNRIQIKVAVGNERSMAIPKRLGFQFEGVERSGELIESRFHDLEIYSLLKNDQTSNI